MKAFCREQGVASVGFTDLPESLVFREKAALFPNAIVLTFEMDKARIDKAPSLDTGIVVHETYRDLGFAANRLAKWLRERAGLGAMGSHGILIPPEHGRLSHVDTETCFPVFLDQFGCSICVKECPFSSQSYGAIREHHVSTGRDKLKGSSE